MTETIRHTILMSAGFLCGFIVGTTSVFFLLFMLLTAPWGL